MAFRSLIAAAALGAVRAQGGIEVPEVPQACTGSADPTGTPLCFKGSDSILGITEDVSVKVSSYAGGKGKMDFVAAGFKGVQCQGLDFTKSGQDIAVDVSSCSGASGITLTAKWCSDTQTIETTVQDSSVPIPITITLAKDACEAEVPEVPQACTGSADPTSTPLCFKGSDSILGITEDVSVKVSSYAGGKGKMDFVATGFKGVQCQDLDFTKSGQDIAVDVSSCSGASGITLSAKWCSDTQTIETTVQDSSVPIPITITLAKDACEVEVPEVPQTCTGSADPTGTPLCFKGSDSILGITEDVSVKVSSYAGGKGTMDFVASGFKGVQCTDLAFTKSGQDIAVDLSSCSSATGITLAAKWCSDTQTIETTVQDSAVPIPLTITLAKDACEAEVPKAPQACTGSADPTGVPLCFKGSDSILGITEDVSVKVSSYAGGKGTMDFVATGFKGVQCKDLAFTKSGQDIAVDVSSCSGATGITLTAKWCSDTQTIETTVQDSSVPIPITITLAKDACDVELIV